MKLPSLERWLSRSRVPGRLLTLAGLILRLPLRPFRRQNAPPKTILVLHHLLLGDTVMLAGLLSKLRQRHTDSAIHMAAPTASVALFSARPYDVEVHPFNPRQLSTLLGLFRLRRPDLVIIPAENRYSLLAAALGARHIVAFEGDHPAWKIGWSTNYDPTREPPWPGPTWPPCWSMAHRRRPLQAATGRNLLFVPMHGPPNRTVCCILEPVRHYGFGHPVAGRTLPTGYTIRGTGLSGAQDPGKTNW